jgi:hypothetical protein
MKQTVKASVLTISTDHAEVLAPKLARRRCALASAPHQRSIGDRLEQVVHRQRLEGVEREAVVGGGEDHRAAAAPGAPGGTGPATGRRPAGCRAAAGPARPCAPARQRCRARCRRGRRTCACGLRRAQGSTSRSRAGGSSSAMNTCMADRGRRHQRHVDLEAGRPRRAPPARPASQRQRSSRLARPRPLPGRLLPGAGGAGCSRSRGRRAFSRSTCSGVLGPTWLCLTAFSSSVCRASGGMLPRLAGAALQAGSSTSCIASPKRSASSWW